MTTWRPWKPEEDQRVVDMANNGACLDEIVDAIGRTRDAVHCRISYLRKTLDDDAMPEKLRDPRQPRKRNTAPANIKHGGRGEQKERICLGCGRVFPSAHCMNRLCNTCRGRSASPYAP